MSYNPVPVPPGSITETELADGSVSVDKMDLPTLGKQLIVQETQENARSVLDATAAGSVVPFTF